MADAPTTSSPAQKAVTIEELGDWLLSIVESKNTDSVMIWGPPGIGKSAVVKDVARRAGFKVDDGEFEDIRISQLAPTDLRGLPVPDWESESAKWYAPEFLPRSGKGILFLDEINMAPPVVMGIAQQLVLDRRVGSLEIPKGWFIWAAGNRAEDKATVFDMSAPLANRFLHINVRPDLEAFVKHASQIDPKTGRSRLDYRIISFLQFRTGLLHQISTKRPAWPSPRSWFMANKLLSSGPTGNEQMRPSIAPAVGEEVNREFRAFLVHWAQLPDIDSIVAGRGGDISFPVNLDVRWALMGALVERATGGIPSMSREQQKTLGTSRIFNTLEWVYDKAFDPPKTEQKRGATRDFATIIAGNMLLAIEMLGPAFSGYIQAQKKDHPKAEAMLSGKIDLSQLLKTQAAKDKT